MKIPRTEEHEFELAPAGNHVAVCVAVIDLGTQESNGQYGHKVQRKVMITWELPTEEMSDGRPFVVSSRYTLSGYKEAMLIKHLNAWRGVPFSDADFESFDLKNLLGKGCMLNCIHNQVGDKTYCNVSSIAQMPTGISYPKPANPLVHFSFDDVDLNVLNELHDWIKLVIEKSPEFKALDLTVDSDVNAKMDQAAQIDNGPAGDEVPF